MDKWKKNVCKNKVNYVECVSMPFGCARRLLTALLLYLYTPLLSKSQIKSFRLAPCVETQVIVVPSNEVFTQSFATFNTLIESINQARRNARDYVTDVSSRKAR